MAMNRQLRRVALIVTVVAAIVARVLRAAGAASFPLLVPLVLGLAALALVAGTGYQAWVWSRSRGAQKQAEGLLLLSYAGMLIAGVLYFCTTDTGVGWLGLGDLPARSRAKYDTIMMVAMALTGLCAFVPAMMMEATVGRWQARDADGVELKRTKEVGLAGLSIALAAGFLMVTCNVAREKNVKSDLSYFRTAAPGESTRKIVDSMSTPLRVLMFFPDQNEVGQEVEGYFKELARQTKRVGIEHYDRLLSKTLAEKYQVQQDGTVVLVRGADKDEKWAKLDLDTDLEKARRQTGKLRVLDETVNTELLKLMREKRKAYLTVGHGEINDPESLPEHLRGKLPEGRAQVLSEILTQLGYEQKTIGAMSGLATDIPPDATFVMVLGPKTAFEPAELDALGRYLDRGGHLLVAMDPQGDFRLGPLEGKLGVGLGELRPGQPARIGLVTDDKNFLPQRGNDADRQFALTNQFSSHAATTSLSRGGAHEGILLQSAGALFDRELTGSGEKPRHTYVVRSMAEAWLDFDGDYKLSGDEKRDRYNIGAAIEGKFRALVFSDQDLFSDHAVQTMTGQVFLDTNGRALPVDAVRWLGGEENIAGIVNNEKETEMRQTPRQQAGWFVATTVIAPLGVLGVGLLLAYSARRKPRATRKEKAS
jgi:ABC-type uncharacterized transport system